MKAKCLPKIKECVISSHYKNGRGAFYKTRDRLLSYNLSKMEYFTIKVADEGRLESE